ncbi:hypothetical protein CFE70_008570 [Pyrenophora teres f. teres 0-1]
MSWRLYTNLPSCKDRTAAAAWSSLDVRVATFQASDRDARKRDNRPLRIIGACLDAPSNGKGSGPSTYIAPDVYDSLNPVPQCFSPCTLIMPPWSIVKPTTISRLDVLARVLTYH